MKALGHLEVWLVVGSQELYGQEAYYGQPA